ncbi:non-ribosomal peptide synthetase [Micromonospora inyonensis]|uniref:Amino acid adenylation domain-containing protein n=1 Tax=Micromonospora inyonensis TaxID=47866 RepID=A0A1C6S7X4_9ACTN|nr:non-ribosomal peptide synthetase [Micromonospora inyonensis]SCL25359.1 amino acid adenylation domain-containing protein [Micromonospora inyonensis]
MTATETADLLRRFDQVVAERPEDLAVVGPAATPTSPAVTYAALAARVDRLARAMDRHGVRRGDVVGVCLPRQVDLLASLLAAWRLGAAFVPMDPAYPGARLRAMAVAAGVRTVLAGTSGAPWEAETSTVRVDQLPDDPLTDRALPSVDVTPGEPAYVIFTSGSTGTPKGVQVSRGAVTHLVDSLERVGLYPSEPSRVAWNASVSFDASVQQWVRICRGDTVLLIGDDLRTDPQRLADWLRANGATALDVTPTHWQVLAGAVTQPVRLFVGGEPVPPWLWRDLAARSGPTAVNLYGPTECTVDATAAWITGEDPVIGRPLPGVRAYVLDDDLEPARTGELYLAGPGVADGYRGQPGRTAERFLADPVAADGSRMYRTGDRVHQRPDGAMEYLGRTDRQVKVHGFRIEPGEIEAALVAHPDVAAAAVLPYDDPHRGTILVAYHVGAADGLRDWAADRLPTHLLPASFTALESFPRTVSGKLDLSALPAPRFPAESSTASVGSEVESLIADVWGEVLGRSGVGADDDFFALGGHSLLALHVVAAIRKRLGVRLPSIDIYERPRLRDLAERVAELAATEAVPSTDPGRC